MQMSKLGVPRLWFLMAIFDQVSSGNAFVHAEHRWVPALHCSFGKVSAQMRQMLVLVSVSSSTVDILWNDRIGCVAMVKPIFS